MLVAKGIVIGAVLGAAAMLALGASADRSYSPAVLRTTQSPDGKTIYLWAATLRQDTRADGSTETRGFAKYVGISTVPEDHE